MHPVSFTDFAMFYVLRNHVKNYVKKLWKRQNVSIPTVTDRMYSTLESKISLLKNKKEKEAVHPRHDKNDHKTRQPHDKTTTRQDKTRQDKARQDKTRLGKTRQG